MMGKSTSDQGISVRNHHPQERITSPRPLTLGSYPSHNLSSFDLPAPLSKRRHLTPAEHELLTSVDSINAYKSHVHPPSIHSEHPFRTSQSFQLSSFYGLNSSQFPLSHFKKNTAFLKNSSGNGLPAGCLFRPMIHMEHH